MSNSTLPQRKAIVLLPGQGRAYPMGRIAAVFKADGEAATAWVQQVHSWDFDTVCGCHLSPAISNGKAEFERCYSFLLSEG